MTQYKITTNDNPYNPFENWDEWLSFDIEMGYYSCAKLDRIVDIKDNFTELEIAEETNRAIEEIIKHDFTDTYSKATKDYPDDEEEVPVANIEFEDEELKVNKSILQ